MRVLRALLWLGFAVALVATSIYLTGNYELVDRVTSLFLTAQSWLPLAVSLEQFLLIFLVASLLLLAFAVSLCLAFLVALGASRQRRASYLEVTRRELTKSQEARQLESEQLFALSQALTKQLDKRVIVQAIVEAASRMTSGSQANTIASLWLLHFETDTLRFEQGLYCDETMFAQTACQLTDATFSRAVTTQRPVLLSRWQDGVPLLKPERAASLGAATGVLLVPFVIESAVLGVLLLFCHSDVVKSYESRKGFYDAIWAELTLALAIAVQGEVAILDRLTGTHNREYFMKRLVQELERANRYQLAVSLLMIDIDNFKLVNDMLGHPQGDVVLKIIAKLIKSSIRVIDLAGRYGGEEFIVLLPETGYGEGASSGAGAIAVAERIRKAVDDEFQGMQKPLSLTISLGVVCRRFPEDRDVDYQELIRRADEQLYRAKTTGKNKVCVFAAEPSGAS